MRRIQNSSLLLALALALVPVACSQEEQAPNPSEQKQEVTQPAETPAKKLDKGKLGKLGKFRKDGKFGRRDGHGSGAAQLLMKTALKDLELSDAQKETIAALKPEGKGDRKAGRADMKQAMIDAAKSGKVDEKAFEAQLSAMKERQAERTAARAKLLNGLYAALEPEQRVTLVTKVKAEMEARQKRMEERQAKRAELAKDGDLKQPGPMKGMHGKRGFKGMTGPKGGHFGMLARGLELTEAQQSKLDALAEKGKADMPNADAIKNSRAEMHKKMNELLDAFAKDGFDATKFDLSPKHKDMGEMMKKQVAHMNEFLAILTPEQRAKLAENIEKGPAMGGHGMKRGMPHFDRDRAGADEGQEDDDLLGDDLDQGLDDIEDEVMGDDQAAE